LIEKKEIKIRLKPVAVLNDRKLKVKKSIFYELANT
jgi:hypothetical protein